MSNSISALQQLFVCVTSAFKFQPSIRHDFTQSCTKCVELSDNTFSILAIAIYFAITGYKQSRNEWTLTVADTVAEAVSYIMSDIDVPCRGASTAVVHLLN